MSSGPYYCPLVSVLMPVYNGERTLAESIKSILNQTFDRFEFIIVDDGSTDKTPQILEEYAARDPRLVLLLNQVNLGVARSLNRGFSVPRGTYIARQDADDLSASERLKVQVAYMEDHPEIGVLGTWAQAIDVDGNPLGVMALPDNPALARWWLLFDVCVHHSSVLMRRALVRQAGGYSHDRIHAEDYDLWQRMSPKAGIVNLPEVLISKRLAPDRISARFAQVQGTTVMGISRAAICDLLGERVTLQEYMPLHRTIRGRSLADAAAIWRTARLLQRIYQAFFKSESLSSEDARVVRKDLANKLYMLAGHNIGVSLWAFLCLTLRAMRLDPRLPESGMVARLVKLRWRSVPK